MVLQYNKRDLAEEGIPLIPVEIMEGGLNKKLKAPSYPASALKGMGVGATLKECLKLTLRNLQQELTWAG
jgi:hypothetical protein